MRASQSEPGDFINLASRIRSGDAAAEEQFVRMFSRSVLAIAWSRTGDYDGAQDVMQEVMWSVLKALREGRVQEPEKLPAYICRAAENQAAGYTRTRARRKELPLCDITVPISEERSVKIGRIDLQRVLQALNALDQKILLMMLVDELGPGEVAARLNLSPEVVRARKSRAIKKIKKIVTKGLVRATD
jgi:RNA polymerase sigma factor (sigma-70 family)